MGRIVTTGQLGIAIEPDLDRLKGLLADNGGPWDRNPCLRGGRLLTRPRPHGPQGGFAVAGWGGAGPATIGRPGLGGRPEHTAH
jgi:hypothetical protein